MLSIGLGQEQQFTAILQTVQQLLDVYGDTADKTIQGNTSNIIFLKSTDDSLLEQLEKMSGKTHRTFTDSKTITRNFDQVLFQNEGAVSYTHSTVEEPLISTNDMAFIKSNNSIVFRAGDSPVWNRSQMALPMWYALSSNPIRIPETPKLGLRDVPSTSSVLDFDVRKNQPDFRAILEERINDAKRAEQARKVYMGAHGYKDIDVLRMDPDVYAEQVMDVIYEIKWESFGLSEEEREHLEFSTDPDVMALSEDEGMLYDFAEYEPDTEQIQTTQSYQAKNAEYQARIYADGQVSREMLVTPQGRGLSPSAINQELVTAFVGGRSMLAMDTDHFELRDQDLYGLDGKLYVHITSKTDIDELTRSIESRGLTVDDDGDALGLGSVQIQPAFLEFLAGLTSWRELAKGDFERRVAAAMRRSLEDMD